jgi:PAS domain S-box-containing protein
VIGLVLTSWLEFDMSMNPMGMHSMSNTEICYYCPVPLLFWAAIRFGMPGASIGFAIVTFFSVNAAIHGHGFFYAMSPPDTALALQEFLLARTAPLYLVAILIQQKENVEHSLRESEERFRNMADTAPVCIWMVGPDKLCTFCNRGWLEFTGRTLEQELGTGWTDNIHPDDITQCVDVYHSAFNARQPFEMEYRLRRHDGKYRWVFDRGVPRYAANGEFLGYIGTVMDLTDRKQAEEARQELAHASRLAMVGELTAMVAHELNQPLSAILANADAMNTLLDLQIAPVEEVREILADIRRDDLRATEAIRRIRALVSKREMEMLPVDINEVVAEVVHLARSDASRRGIQIRENYCAKVPTVKGDIVHLQQVMLNLILNGMDAMKDIPATERKLLVSSTCNASGAVEVSVRDNGQGIPPENLTQVFKSFFTTKENGMGIGLSMARSIVQLHAGRMWAENNRDGKGTTFHFTIPSVKTTPVPSDGAARFRGHLAETV